jgi:ATP-dependent DNA helicase DinG
MSDVAAALQRVIDAVDGEFRDGQQTMAQAVMAALDSGQHLLVQAGTGTGKSLAYLVPAIMHAAQHDVPVVIATATLALQRQLIERDLPAACGALEPIVGRPIRAAVLKGRANYVCLERLHNAGAEGPAEELPLIGGSRLEMQAKAVRAWALHTPTGDRDDFAEVVDARVWAGVSVTSRECVGESRCAFGEECFAARARLAAMDADIVVTNHALLAIDAIEGVPVLPEHSAVIVDEAHELVDRITTALSTSLGVQQIDRMITRMRPFVEADQLERLDQARQAWVSAIEHEGGRFAELPEAVLSRMLPGSAPRARLTRCNPRLHSSARRVAQRCCGLTTPNDCTVHHLMLRLPCRSDCSRALR